MKNRNIIINSSIAFIIAAIVEMTIHECGHFFAAIALGGSPVLHHNYVSYGGSLPEHARMVSAMAGPLVSLLIGIWGQAIMSGKRLKGMNALVLQYFSLFGYIGFLGYMAIAPFFAYGDTGYVLRAIGCPYWLIIVLAVSSIGCMFLISKQFSVHFIAMMSKTRAEDLAQRRKFIYWLVFIPLFIGIAITTLLNLPVPTTLSLIAPLTSPYVLLWPFHYYLKDKGTYFEEQETIGQKVSLNWLAVMVIVILINRLLVGGISFG